jgi:uncharacterized membrane protein
VSEQDWALFLHLVGVVVLAGGVAIAGAGFIAARRRHRPSEIALLLGTTRIGVVLVGLGSLAVLAGGFWLVAVTDADFGDGWLAAGFGLFVVSSVLGALGGRAPKRARILGERLAREADEPSAELRRLLDDRRASALNLLSTMGLLAVLLLMVWRPSG